MLRLRSDKLAWREINGETLLVDLRRSVYLGVNGSATVLWRKLAEGTDRDELVAALADAYSLDPAQAREDVDAFLDDCWAREIIEEDG